MSLFGALVNAIQDLHLGLTEAIKEIEWLRSAKDNAVIDGKVTDRDPKKARVRIAIGLDADGKDVKSPWIAYSQIAGTRKVHTVPSINQQLRLFCPNGDLSQAVTVPLTWWDENPAPSEDGDEDIDLRGKTRRTQRDANLKQEIDGVTRVYTKQSVAVTIHKDPENSDEGKDEKVDDAHPWKGNRAKKKHTRTINKDAGYALKINDGDDEKEHTATVHPDDGTKFTTFKEKNLVHILKDLVKVAYDKDKHKTEYSDEGIKHTSAGAISHTAQSTITHTAGDLIKNIASIIQHQGKTNLLGELNVSEISKFAKIVQVGGITQLFGGLSTGALEVAMDDDGGLVEAQFAFKAGNGSLIVDKEADGGRCHIAHGLNVSAGGDANNGIAPGAFKATAANKVLIGPETGADAVPTFRTLTGADLPKPGTDALGGVKRNTGSGFVNGIDADGALTFGTPTGTYTLPAASADALGGVKSIAAASHKFLTSIGTDGTPAAAQPAFTDISGTVSAAQLAGLNSLGNYANDSAAATGGVAVGGLYRNGSTLCVRVS